MKTVTHPDFLLLFPEVRVFRRLESPSPVKGVFQDKNVCLKLFYFSIFFFSVVKDNFKCFFV